MLKINLIFIALLPFLATAQDRMPPIPKDKWSPELQKVTSTRGALVGPWIPLSRTPEVMALMMDMRTHVAQRSLLSNALTEMAILIAARNWTNNYEWNAHSTLAAQEKLSPAIVSAIAQGRRPEHMADDEEILYDFCTELLHNQGVSDATYARALAKFGEPGVVEAASLEGYYTFLSMVMNTARTALPEGAKPQLAAFPANH